MNANTFILRGDFTYLNGSFLAAWSITAHVVKYTILPPSLFMPPSPTPGNLLIAYHHQCSLGSFCLCNFSQAQIAAASVGSTFLLCSQNQTDVQPTLLDEQRPLVAMWEESASLNPSIRDWSESESA